MCEMYKMSNISPWCEVNYDSRGVITMEIVVHIPMLLYRFVFSPYNMASY